MYFDPTGEFMFNLFGVALGASGIAAPAILSNPVGWAIGGAVITAVAIGWATNHLINSRQISPSTGSAINTVVGGLAGSMINSMDYIGNSSSMPQVGSAYGWVVINKNKESDRRSSDDPGAPPYRGDILGNDGSKNPGVGFEWKGKGPPGSAQGQWVRGPKDTQESLHPDLYHPEPVGPHWDYEGPGFPKGARIYSDGTWSPK
jgi:hypothetical protein